MKRSERVHCPHLRVRAIYGDEINHTPGGRRLQCLHCDTYLDGGPQHATDGIYVVSARGAGKRAAGITRVMKMTGLPEGVVSHLVDNGWIFAISNGQRPTFLGPSASAHHPERRRPWTSNA